jgi:hypothetical protein
MQSLRYATHYLPDDIKVFAFDDGTFTVADEGGYLPGYYATFNAAKAAVDADPDLVQELAELARERGTPITEQELSCPTPSAQ